MKASELLHQRAAGLLAGDLTFSVAVAVGRIFGSLAQDAFSMMFVADGCLPRCRQNNSEVMSRNDTNSAF
jgi:hypothetical protein